MSIVCKDCGFENEDGERYCAMCNADLSATVFKEESVKSVTSSFPQPLIENEALTVAQVKTIAQVNEAPKAITSGSKKYFVSCENSRSKTYVESNTISSYYCEGCKEEHLIDGFFWIVQEEAEPDNISLSQNLVESAINQVSSRSGQHLVLEDIDTHVKIEISSTGGTFGRYGTFGSAYLQSDPRGRMVSGEHCRFKYEYGRWSIEHLSRTNDTVYNGRKLEHGFEEAIRDGKIITFANAISFIVRIF